VDLPPGTSARALLTVSAPLPWNREKQRQITIAATPDLPGAAGGTSTATFVQKPRFASKFAKFAGIGAAVVVLAAAIAVPTLLAQGKNKTTPAAVNGPATTPAATTAAATQAPPSAAATTAAASSAAAAPPPASSAPPAASSAPASASTGTGTGTEPRTVDLTKPVDGVVASDFFRDQGFLVSADPGTTAVAGCTEARTAAVVTGADGKRFMTSSTPDDPTKCHEVPLMIDFLPDTPAGAVQLSPVTPDTLGLEVVYRDLSRATLPGLSVSADLAKAHGGVDFLLVRPGSADGAATPPVAVTAISFAPLS
jgi:hypothetical protein